MYTNFIAMSKEKGCLSQVRASVDPTLQPLDYLGPNGFMQASGFPVVQDTTAYAKDDKVRVIASLLCVQKFTIAAAHQAAAALWKLSVEQTGLNFGSD